MSNPEILTDAESSTSSEETTDNESRPASYIVGIGASAGGLEALERLFTAMPARTGMAFVVIQHLSPDFKSLTDELLARRTPIPIRQVEDGMRLRPDTIYLLPPRKEMILAEDRLLLTDKDPSQSMTLPIDGFFRSLAQNAGERAIGVILSGTGSDGSRGIRDIRSAGGLVIAQAPESAKFDGMPKSAIGTNVVELVLTPEEVPDALVRHAQQARGQLTPIRGPGGASPSQGMETIFRLLRDSFGIDFSAYKPDTVARRTDRRMSLLRLNTLEEYAARLEADVDERNHLYKDFLIGVTGFFRDREAFARLGEALPPLLKRVCHDEEFRVWVSGCATGEEAYSLAILIQECAESIECPVSVKVFATDVHRTSLDFAGNGVYDAAALAGVGPERLERFFVPKGDRFQVSAELRKRIVFAHHNVLKDAPFTKLDLVSCRNLLIYFQPAAQKKVLSLFHFGLKTGGLMFLGPSEGTGELGDEFENVDTRWKLFRKRRDVRLPPEIRLAAPAGPERIRVPSLAAAAGSPHDPHLLEALLERCMPPSVLVNARREVVRTFAGANRFLKLQDGWVSTDVLDLVDPELRTALAGALPRVFREMTRVAYRSLRVRLPDGEKRVDLSIDAVRSARADTTYALVKFQVLEASSPPAEPDRGFDIDQASEEQRISLEAELRTTKENLQAMIEELGTSNEELQAANEELVASNEELQSTNEELHSVNEELHTVNAEYQRKIAELTELTADMDNLLLSTEIHTIFLDRELRIRKFTPKIAETFNLLPQDVGRRIDSFTHGIDHPGLLDDIHAVLRTSTSVERQVRDRQGQWFLMRALPYRSGTSVDGVVLTLIDIHRMKQVEAEVRRQQQQLEGILRNSPSWVFVKDLQGRYLMANDAMRNAIGVDPIGKTARELFPADVAEAPVSQQDRVIAGEVDVEEIVAIPHPDGLHTYLSVLFPIHDETGRISAIGGIRTDVTQLKRAEAEARAAVAQRDRFLAVLSHELRNPLAAIVNATRLIGRLGTGSPEAADWFKVVERRTRHMARLLDDLLDVTRITQDKIEIRKRPFDLIGAIPEVLEEVRPWFDERGVSLEITAPRGPLMLAGDPARLHQIQVNLLMNAAKYTPEGGRVKYVLERQGDQVEIRVRDNGVGMSRDLLQKAFDLFVQADETLDRADGGMGVGLTLVRSIVERHGGQVHARSEGPGLGSEFVVRLPLGDVSQATADPQPTDDRDGVAYPAAVAGAGRSVLVVEDDEDIRDSLRSILELDGYRVVTAADGPQALAVLKRDVPDVALIDIGIPGLDGYELARRVRDRFAPDRLRLIALTGYGRPEDRRAAHDAGFDDHLTKPYNLKDLEAVLARVHTASE